MNEAAALPSPAVLLSARLKQYYAGRADRGGEPSEAREGLALPGGEREEEVARGRLGKAPGKVREAAPVARMIENCSPAKALRELSGTHPAASASR